MKNAPLGGIAGFLRFLDDGPYYITPLRRLMFRPLILLWTLYFILRLLPGPFVGFAMMPLCLLFLLLAGFADFWRRFGWSYISYIIINAAVLCGLTLLAGPARSLLWWLLTLFMSA